MPLLLYHQCFSSLYFIVWLVVPTDSVKHFWRDLVWTAVKCFEVFLCSQVLVWCCNVEPFLQSSLFCCC